jgi:thiol-disulfide isomerase/thioredoxin
VHAGPVAQTPSKEALERMDKEITAFVKDTTEARAVTYAKVMRVQLYGRWNDPQAEPVLKELAADKDPAVAKMAAQQIAARERARKPVELKFTALDGAEVDVAKLRGKVVLVDFWATWCGPCRAELPNVLATYQKYHDKGFEIIGISLDEDKDKLTAFLKDKGMAWPQHFDGKGWQNEVSSANGINSIPAMWVLDKKGMIRSENARGVELDALVAKLLAE